MKHIFIPIIISLLFLASPVLAGTGHYHGPSKDQPQVSSKEVAKRASIAVKELADKGKIDPSWVGLKESNIEQKAFNQELEWVVSYNNKEIQDTSKQTLYVFFTLFGEYIAANYSGN